MSEINFIHARVRIWYEDLDKEICMFVADKHKTSPLNSSFWILDLQTISQTMGCLSHSCQGNSMHERHGVVGRQILKQLYEPLISAFIIQCFALPQYCFHKSCGSCFATQQHEELIAVLWFTERLSQQKKVLQCPKGQENRDKLPFNPQAQEESYQLWWNIDQASRSASWKGHAHFAAFDKKYQVMKFPDSTDGHEDKHTETFQTELLIFKKQSNENKAHNLSHTIGATNMNSSKVLIHSVLKIHNFQGNAVFVLQYKGSSETLHQ